MLLISTTCRGKGYHWIKLYTITNHERSNEYQNYQYSANIELNELKKDNSCLEHNTHYTVCTYILWKSNIQLHCCINIVLGSGKYCILGSDNYSYNDNIQR